MPTQNQFPAVIEVVIEIDGWTGVAETLKILRTDHERWLAEQEAGESAAEA